MNQRTISQTCCVSETGFEKRDALLYDRVYYYNIINERIPDDIAFSIPAIDAKVYEYLMQLAYAHGEPKDVQPYGRVLVLENCRRQGIAAIPCYSELPSFYRDFPPGWQIAYDAAINNLPLVDPKRVTWEEIAEFRRDPEAKRKYRDLHLWLQSALNAESVQHATDLIAQRIDDYAWSIKKHGLNTSIGMLTQVLDYKQSATTAAVSATAGLLAGPVAAAVASGVMIGAQVVAWVAQRNVDLADAARGANREVAILYDAQRRFGDGE
jgi:hypothetical protein